MTLTFLFVSTASVELLIRPILTPCLERLVTLAQGLYSLVFVSSLIHHASDWLHVVPSTSLGLHLSDWEFRLCLKYWLGLHIFEEDTLCLVCGCTSDIMGHHCVTCRSNGDLIHKHGALHDVLYTTARSAVLACKKENSITYPWVSFSPYWSQGKPAALDISIISPLQTLMVEEAAVTQGYPLAVRKQQKRRCHDNACCEASIHFIPLAVEPFGGWSEEAAATIRQFGNLLDLLPSHCILHLFQQLSLTVWQRMLGVWPQGTPAFCH